MEASALKYQAGIGLHGRSPLLRLQSDERLITLLRRGNTAAFEVLFARYETRLLSFCRHLLGSREDAEDVLQEVMTAAFHAILADERPINVRPWLYRIARNRSLNHLRKTQAIGVDSMDHHLSENGASTADKVHERERFRLLVGDIQELPESQRTALVLREMDALSYEQIAEAMETTVSSVKSLLVRARLGLAESAEARQLSCEDVRLQLAEVAEGLQKKPGPLVRRHLKGCTRCAEFRGQLKATNKALAALLPVGPLVVVKKLALLHLGHSAGAGSTATATAAAGSTAGAGVGAGAAIGSGVLGGGSVISAGLSAVGTKAAAGLAAAVIVTAGAVEVGNQSAHHPAAPVASAPAAHPAASAIAPVHPFGEKPSTAAVGRSHHTARREAAVHRAASVHTPPVTTGTPVASSTTVAAAPATTVSATTTTTPSAPTTTPGRVQTQTDPTILPPTTSTPAPPIAVPTVPAAPTGTGTTGTTATGTTTTGTTTTGTTATGTTTGGTTATTPTTATGTTSTATTGTASTPTTQPSTPTTPGSVSVPTITLP